MPPSMNHMNRNMTMMNQTNRMNPMYQESLVKIWSRYIRSAEPKILNPEFLTRNF